MTHNTIRFSIPDIYKSPPKGTPVYERNPESLHKLCRKIVDKLPLPDCYKWTKWEVMDWIERIGFKEYRRTFYQNSVTGRNLILVDVTALTRMNIHRIEHIEAIRLAIRELYHLEPEEFKRSITLPYAYPETCYRHFKARTGPITDRLSRSKFWRQHHILSGEETKSQVRNHWDIECKTFKKLPIVLIGYAPRYKLYQVRKAPDNLPEVKEEPPKEDKWDKQFDRILRVANKPRRFHVTLKPREHEYLYRHCKNYNSEAGTDKEEEEGDELPEIVITELVLS